jgi:hypothetical protein
VHQDDYCSDTEHIVQEGDDNQVLHNVEGGLASLIEGNLEELIRKRRKLLLFLKIVRMRRKIIQCFNILMMVATTTMMTCP